MSVDTAGKGLRGAPSEGLGSPEQCLEDAAYLGHLGTSARSPQRHGGELVSQKEVEGEGRRSPPGGKIRTRRDVPKLRVLQCRRHSQHRGLEQKRENTRGAWQESGGVRGAVCRGQGRQGKLRILETPRLLDAMAIRMGLGNSGSPGNSRPSGPNL